MNEFQWWMYNNPWIIAVFFVIILAALFALVALATKIYDSIRARMARKLPPYLKAYDRNGNRIS